MKILSVYDKEFARYGHVITGYDVRELLETLDRISPLPEIGTEYVPGNPVLEALPVAKQFAVNEYGGMPIQLGWCNGHNTKMNCLEYHRDSEVNLGTKDFILLLAKIDDIEDGKLDSAKVKAFLCPAGVPVEVKVLVILPKGTNGPKPEMTPVNDEDKLLWACNKWLLAHPDSREAGKGAVAAIVGENIDIASALE